ncbi:MAG: hypothetical protein KDK70_10695 [Myxococcales bacterium]|nr:hypothetical protein [Myxococcales bacterium]
MVTDRFLLTPEGAAMLVSTRAEDRVTCPHCGQGIAIAEVEAEPGCLAVACPHCRQRSLLVRLVWVLHRAVQWPGELLAQLGGGALGGASALRMPEAAFGLRVSRGAVVLLAMLWQQAEATGSTTVASSINGLARRLLSTRAVIRKWLDELEKAGALRERLDDGKHQHPRQWELLSLAGEEGHDG